jgi:hypothetical protein
MQNDISIEMTDSEQDFAPAIAELNKLVQSARAAVDVCQASARRAAMDYVQAGEALREVKQYLGAGHGGDRKSSGQLVHLNEKGWVSLCAEQLGMSYKTADRYIADANAFETLTVAAEHIERAGEYLQAVQNGHVRATVALAALEQFQALPEADVQIDPSRWAGLEKELKTQAEVVRFREMETAALAGDALAANELEQVAKGKIPLNRAYAGWQGGLATKDKTRRDPDYAKLMIKSSTTLLNTWGKYYSMPTEVRRAASDALVAVMTSADLPDEVGRELFTRLSERYGQAANPRK